MSDQFFSDLHCHPAMRPMMLEKTTLWDTHLNKKYRKIIRHQKKGKRGGLYDQSGYPKLINSRVKIIYASIYSLEQGFMMNNSLLIGGVNLVLKVKLIFPLILNLVGVNLHLRDFIMSIYTKYPVGRLRKLKDQEYWDGFEEELNYYKNDNNKTGNLKEDNINEIKTMLDFAYDTGTTNNIKTSGVFSIADGNWDGHLPPNDEVLTVLTMEGMAMVSQTKHGGGHSKHGTKLLNENIIADRFKFLKEKVPVFFVTFSHHFSSELCGHARSFPNKARNLGLLNQEYFINQGFSSIGYKSLQYLLSVKLENGQWLRDYTAGRRILIDVKHMSLKGRLSLYQLVRGYNTAHPNDMIPIIASHIGFSNRTIAEMLYAIKTKNEKDKTQSEPTTINGRKHFFNTWSINLGYEEVGIIVETGGLIGVSLEQNNLGVAFGKKTKKKSDSFFAQLVMNQMLSMAKASQTKGFWDCVTMGTDFDGLIDPVDRYSSTLFFEKLRANLHIEFSNISHDERVKAHLDHLNVKQLLSKIFFDNAHKFLQTHFKTADMPKL